MGFRPAEQVVLPMPTAGMDEPEEPKQIRPAIVDDIVWVLVHSSGDVDAAALVLQLFDASEAEFDLAFALAQQRLRLPGDQDIEALQAKIARLVFGEVPDDARELDNPPRH
jgi:hypothetical protein